MALVGEPELRRDLGERFREKTSAAAPTHAEPGGCMWLCCELWVSRLKLPLKRPHRHALLGEDGGRFAGAASARL